MNLSELVQTWGYAAIAVGAFLEGETILALGGFAAHRGYLNLHGVILTALVFGFVGDQFWFWLGRRHGTWVLDRFPRLRAPVQRALRRVERRPHAVIFFIRFLVGLRIAGPIALGTSSVSPRLFMALNLAGAVVWAVLFGVLGYVFGQAIEAVLDRLHNVEWIALALLAAGIGLAHWAPWRRRVADDPGDAASPPEPADAANPVDPAAPVQPGRNPPGP
jgi:membrane protein DedA with SNARE-associated domain